MELTEEQHAEVYEVEGAEFPISGEELWGWPHFLQEVAYPECRLCGQHMQMLLQIDSYRGLDLMFGDSGVGYVTACPEHRDELAFWWDGL